MLVPKIIFALVDDLQNFTAMLGENGEPTKTIIFADNAGRAKGILHVVTKDRNNAHKQYYTNP